MSLSKSRLVPILPASPPRPSHYPGIVRPPRTPVRKACENCRKRKARVCAASYKVSITEKLLKCSGSRPCRKCNTDGTECVFSERVGERLTKTTKELEECKSRLSNIFDALRSPDSPLLNHMQVWSRHSAFVEEFIQNILPQAEEAEEEDRTCSPLVFRR